MPHQGLRLLGLRHGPLLRAFPHASLVIQSPMETWVRRSLGGTAAGDKTRKGRAAEAARHYHRILNDKFAVDWISMRVVPQKGTLTGTRSAALVADRSLRRKEILRRPGLHYSSKGLHHPP